MDNRDHELSEAAAEAGLPSGRMIASSKSGYRADHPDRMSLFNATIALDDERGVWWGDLDLSIDEPRLVALAARLRQRLHVFFEADVWGGIDLARAAVTVDATGEVELLDPALARDSDDRIGGARRG